MNWQTAIAETKASLDQLGWRAMGAAAVLLFGLMLATFARQLTRTIMSRRKGTRRGPLGPPEFVWLVLMVLSVVLALAVLGVGGAVIGVLVTIGVALGVFSDSLGGLRLLASRNFRIGDELEIVGKNISGTAVQFTLLGTTLSAHDGSMILVPNGTLFQNPLRNHTSMHARGVVLLEFVVEPNKEGGIPELETMIQDMLAAARHRDPDSAAEILVTRIEASAVTLRVRFATAPYLREGAASEFLKIASAQFARNGMTAHSLSIVETTKLN